MFGPNKLRILVAAMAITGTFVLAGPVSASTQHIQRTQQALVGQCGPQVHNGAQLLNAWGGMQVINTKAVQVIAKKAGWSSTDGQLTTFIIQRGREFQLAKAANVEDFGCKVGSMYSVGKRHYGAGERVIAIVPAQYAPSQVSSTPRAGYTKKVVQVNTVGRGSCANGFSAHVWVVMYVKHSKTPMTSHKTKAKKPAAKKAVPAACVTASGSPLYAPLPSGITVVNGVCTNVTNTTITTQSCASGTPSRASNGDFICVNNTNVNNNTTVVTVPVTVVVTPPATPPCNCTTTPAAPTFAMTWDTINDVPAGFCRPEVLHVNSSVAGPIQISPSVGLISTIDCYQPDSARYSLVTVPATTGGCDIVVYVYEGVDSSATSDTLTAVPLISGLDAASKTPVSVSVPISHSTRG